MLQTNCAGMLSCISMEEIMEFTLRIMETSMMLMRQNTLATGYPVYQHVFIFDMDGLSFKVQNWKEKQTKHCKLLFQTATSKPSIDILEKSISIYQGQYYQSLCLCFFISSALQTTIQRLSRLLTSSTLVKCSKWSLIL